MMPSRSDLVSYSLQYKILQIVFIILIIDEFLQFLKCI